MFSFPTVLPLYATEAGVHMLNKHYTHKTGGNVILSPKNRSRIGSHSGHTLARACAL